MEAKCSYCEFFGDKPHCHNCKIFNGSRTYVPTEINLTLEEIVNHINNNENVEAFNIGDYKNITLYTGETAKLIVLDFNTFSTFFNSYPSFAYIRFTSRGV